MARKKKGRATRTPNKRLVREAAKGERQPGDAAPSEPSPPCGWLHHVDFWDNPNNSIPGWCGSEVPQDLAQLAAWATRQRGDLRDSNNWGGVCVPGKAFSPSPDWQEVQAQHCRAVIRNIYAWLRHHDVADRPPEIEPPSNGNPPVVALVQAMRRLDELVEWLERNSGRIPTHSPDFRSVNWYGTPYQFSRTQALCVKVLWEASESGARDVGDATILRIADSDAMRLPLVFRGNPAMGAMIVEGSTKGTHRLAGPPT